MRHLVFLHTAEVNVVTFERLTLELAPGTATTHIVDTELLARARAFGVDDAALEAALGARLQRFVGPGDLVVCTCSTIGGLAETIGQQRSVRTMRIDRPMAAEAVRLGRRIAVVAAVESTVEPTRALLRDEAASAGREIELVVSVCSTAWERFEANDVRGYATAIADHARSIAPSADVIVLAQGSMSDAADLLGDLGIPVLSSPRLGVSAALRILGSLDAVSDPAG
ncbi:MAG: aspartate/glutamate racemase family protein [Acidimicrobiia bacterium]